MSVAVLRVSTSVSSPNLHLVKNDEAASSVTDREALVLTHRPRALNLARQMMSRWGSKLEPEELQSIVDISLCEAAARFNPEAGVAFITFLFYYLKGNLIRTVAGRVNERLVFVESYERKVAPDTAPGEEQGEDSPMDEPASCEGPDVLCENKQLMRRAVELYRDLKDLDREVLRQTFFDQKKPGEQSRAIGLSRGHISRVRKNALAKLRKKLLAECAISA